MPIYLLNDELIFPPPEGASREGVVAAGGDFRPERLILAYSQGIFPWPHEGTPLLWFSPNPRFVLDLAHVHVGTSLRKTIRACPYEVRFDTRFADVMRGCQSTRRPGQDGTWITDELIEGYSALHQQGLAHSIEAYDQGELVGGLYGVSLGRAFFGESMFARRPDASKIAAVTMFGNLRAWGFHFVDCQVYTDHLSRFGAEETSRANFLQALRSALSEPTRTGHWDVELTPAAALDCLRRGPQAA